MRTLKIKAPAFEDLNTVRVLPASSEQLIQLTASVARSPGDVWCQHQSSIPRTTQRRPAQTWSQPCAFPSCMYIFPGDRMHSSYRTQQLHFLLPSYAPFYNPKDRAFLSMSVPDLTQA